MRKMRLYRLVVEYPDGYYAEDDWEPDGWADDDSHYHFDPDTGCQELDQFYWPAIRNYLSKSGAEGRADLFRKYGATVTVEASDPVTWGGAA